MLLLLRKSRCFDVDVGALFAGFLFLRVKLEQPAILGIKRLTVLKRQEQAWVNL